MSHPVLILCYRFPPYPGIGGRRWAKLASSLARRGREVLVIAAGSPFRHESPWTRDVQDERIRVSRLPPHFPRVLLEPPRGLAGRVGYRLALGWQRLTCSASPFDQASGWRRPCQTLARRLIEEHGIRTVIATGAPFHLLHHAAELRAEREELSLILDFRDPWTDSFTYGMSSLSPARRRREQQMEAYAWSQADVVTAPSPFILERMLERLRAAGSPRLVTLPHCYDPHDLPAADEVEWPPAGELRVVSGGTLYQGVEPQLAELGRALAAIASHDPATSQRLHVMLSTSEQEAARLVGAQAPGVTVEPPLPPREFLARVAGAHLALVFVNEHNRDFQTTKLCEILALGTPVLLLGPRGEAARFLESRELGWALEPGAIEAGFARILALAAARDPAGRSERPFLRERSLGQVTDLLEELLD